MPHRILNDDWSEYDDRKIRGQKDASFFSCEETWEVEYLANKIKKFEPLKPTNEIKTAISHCCQTVKGNKPRKAFVECVMGRL